MSFTNLNGIVQKILFDNNNANLSDADDICFLADKIVSSIMEQLEDNRYAEACEEANEYIDLHFYDAECEMALSSNTSYDTTDDQTTSEMINNIDKK